MNEKTAIIPLLPYADKAIKRLKLDKTIYLALKKNPNEWHTAATAYEVKNEPNACLIEIAPELIGHLNKKEWEYLFAHEIVHSIPGCRNHSKKFRRVLDNAYPPKQWQSIEESIDQTELGPNIKTRTRLRA